MVSLPGIEPSCRCLLSGGLSYSILSTLDSWWGGVTGFQITENDIHDICGVITLLFKQFVPHNVILQQAWFHFLDDALKISFSWSGSLSTRIMVSQGTENEMDSYDLRLVHINPSHRTLHPSQKVRTHTTTNCQGNWELILPPIADISKNSHHHQLPGKLRIHTTTNCQGKWELTLPPIVRVNENSHHHQLPR